MLRWINEPKVTKLSSASTTWQCNPNAISQGDIVTLKDGEAEVLAIFASEKACEMEVQCENDRLTDLSNNRSAFEQQEQEASTVPKPSTEEQTSRADAEQQQDNEGESSGKNGIESEDEETDEELTPTNSQALSISRQSSQSSALASCTSSQASSASANCTSDLSIEVLKQLLKEMKGVKELLMKEVKGIRRSVTSIARSLDAKQGRDTTGVEPEIESLPPVMHKGINLVTAVPRNYAASRFGGEVAKNNLVT